VSSVGAAEPAGSSRADGSADASIGVTLCCAFSDLAVMQKLGDMLRHRGLAVDLLPGIERDADALQLELSLDEGPTIYVLANGEGLAAARLHDLVQLFATERGPAHRLLVLDVDVEEPSRMVVAVLRAHAAMRRHRSSGELPRITRRGLPFAGQSAAPQAGKSPSGSVSRATRETTQREVQPYGVEMDGPGGSSLGCDSRATPRSPTEYGSDARRREVIQLPSGRRRPGSSQDIPRVDDLPQPRAVERRRTPEARAPVPRRKPSPAIGPRRKVTPREIGVVVEVRPPEDERSPAGSTVPSDGERASFAPSPRAVATGHGNAAGRRRERLDPATGKLVRETARRLEAQREATDESSARPAASARKRAALWLGVGGIAIVAVVAVVAMQTADDDTAGLPAHAGLTERGVAASAVGKPSTESKQARPEPTPPEPDAAKPAKPPAVDDAPPVVTARDRVEEAKRIAAALDVGHIHALDALLFFAPGEQHEPTDWTVADGRCTTAAVDRIAGWRLPTVAEARKLRGARRLRSGRYWTAGKPTADGMVPVVASSGGRAVPTATTETALCVCVRRRLAK
jgi:hypothetical protein